MISPYFKVKIQTEEFKHNLANILEQVKGKKVLLYGSCDKVFYLNKVFNFLKELNVVAIVVPQTTRIFKFNTTGFTIIPENQIDSLIYDGIIIVEEDSLNVLYKLENKIKQKKENIYRLFIETIKEERVNVNFLYKNKFDKTYLKLVRQMKNKTIMLYGAGIFLEAINKYFDLSKLNIIGIADKKYSIVNNNQLFLNYPTYNPLEIKDLKPDYLLISTKSYIGIFEYLHFFILKGSKIKVKALVKQSILKRIKEYIDS